MPDVLVAISDRLKRETDPEQAKTFWTATTNLMGLRYSIDEIHSFIRGVPEMLFGFPVFKESSVYQEALREGEAQGRVEEARRFLIFLGREKFGPPDEAAGAKIAALSDLDRLHELGARILDVATWDELLADPSNVPE